MDTKNKVLEVADHLFKKFGIRSVTMDDIAKKLGVSKKTIYQYVKDKDELVFSLMNMVLTKKERAYDEICGLITSPVEELGHVSRQLRKDFSETNPSMMFDLEKYYPKSWELWLKFKDGFIKDNLIRLMENGIKEGVFRKDIDPEILSTLRVEQIEMAFNEKIFPRDKFDFIEVQMAIFEHFVYGILTPKGIELYNDCCK